MLLSNQNLSNFPFDEKQIEEHKWAERKKNQKSKQQNYADDYPIAN